MADKDVVKEVEKISSEDAEKMEREKREREKRKKEKEIIKKNAEKVKAQKKSVRNIYDKETGLPIRVNLYIIKYIYYHIDKAQCFIEEKIVGKRAKSYEIYGSELPVSRQRFDRINKGERFEISHNEAQQIIEKYGIDIKYFRKEEPIMFELDDITVTDWKRFYACKYKSVHNEVKTASKDELEKSTKKILEALNALVNKGWEKLDKSNPLYSICFFFTNGRKWESEDNLTLFRKVLERMDYTEWEEVEIASLKKDFALMKKHYNYIQALLVLDNLRNEKIKEAKKKESEKK